MITFKQCQSIYSSLPVVLIQPPCLKGLTELEEMLISRVMPLMQVRHTRGGQTCYKDHIVNLPQNIQTVATRSPRLPENVNLVLIRKQNVDTDRHVDFVVRRKKVRDALLYKIAHDPDYADLEIDDDALSQLPMNATVVGRVPTIPKPTGASTVTASEPTEAAGVGDDGDLDEAFVGGVLNVGVGHRTEVDEVRVHAAAILDDAGPPEPGIEIWTESACVRPTRGESHAATSISLSRTSRFACLSAIAMAGFLNSSTTLYNVTWDKSSIVTTVKKTGPRSKKGNSVLKQDKAAVRTIIQPISLEDFRAEEEAAEAAEAAVVGFEEDAGQGVGQHSQSEADTEDDDDGTSPVMIFLHLSALTAHFRNFGNSDGDN